MNIFLTPWERKKTIPMEKVTTDHSFYSPPPGKEKKKEPCCKSVAKFPGHTICNQVFFSLVQFFSSSWTLTLLFLITETERSYIKTCSWQCSSLFFLKKKVGGKSAGKCRDLTHRVRNFFEFESSKLNEPISKGEKYLIRLIFVLNIFP